MNTKLLTPHSFVRMPWRNGGGSTLELHSEVDIHHHEPIWRVSIADVADDGPFSQFAGYDRTLTLIDGAGITLHYDNGGSDILSHRFSAAKFRGDDQTRSALHAGPIQNFNVFTLRSHFLHQVVVRPGSANDDWINKDSNLLLVYAVDTDARVRAPNDNDWTIPPHAMLRIDKPIPGVWKIPLGPVILVRIEESRPSLLKTK